VASNPRLIKKTFESEEELGEFMEKEAPKVFNYFSFWMTRQEKDGPWEYHLEYIPGELQ
jgi:hypothetical protein